MKKYDVLCPHCCGTFLETNSHFREDGPANGSMFEPKEHIKDAGWSVFPLYDSTEYADITCPSCGGVLVDSLGKVVRMVVIGEIEGPASKEKVMAKSMDELMAEYEPEVPESAPQEEWADIISDINKRGKVCCITKSGIFEVSDEDAKVMSDGYKKYKSEQEAIAAKPPVKIISFVEALGNVITENSKPYGNELLYPKTDKKDLTLPPDELEEYLRGSVIPLGAVPIVVAVKDESLVKKTRKPRTVKAK